MNPKAFGELRRVNDVFAHKAYKTYKRFMAYLCKAHPNFEASSTISSLLESDSIDELLDLADSLATQTYCSATEHFVANQFAALIRKYPFPHQLTSADPEGNALKKFLKTEHKCFRINQRFRAYNKRSPYEYHLSAMRQFIAYVLGNEPDMLKMIDQAGFGPGSAIGVTGNATNAARKLLAKHWTVTPGAVDYARIACVRHAQIHEFLAHNPDHGYSCYDREKVNQSFLSKVHVTNYNKITFVPKTTKVHRTIAVEPLLNGYLQKGIDEEMRKRLLRINIDLSDQSRNQEFARLGSLDDSLEGFVTIDLSSASDSIAYEVVKNLLPPDWFDLLNSVRSKHGLLNGKQFRFEKFCSMGNGFCFPLETLLFVSAAHAVGCGRPGYDFTVYGDDIIVRKRFAEPLIKLLGIMGFSTNTDKTFISGPFRESCGADWFGGVNVRPYTLDNRFESLESIFKCLNLVQRTPLTKMFFDGLDLEFFKVPKSWRYVRPYPGNDDSAVTVDYDSFISSPYARWDRSLQCWSWIELSHTSVFDRSVRREQGYNFALLYGALSGSTSHVPFAVRRKSHTKVRRLAYSGYATLHSLPAFAH